MGVPAFFTWLMEKYPNIACKLSKDNKFVCDYFYLDMNGIIHPCCHPEGKLKPENEEEMIEFMHRYLDMLFDYVEPTQLLYIAIDGPPPRAKMMQQRERRFIHEYEAQMSDHQDAEEWDSNQITPGTAFMNKVANGLSKYVMNKLSTHCGELKIILSDSSVPGEGEHKILDFIRNLRYRGDYKPTATHLLFSNDADMILLALLLHEPNAYLMRDIPMRRAVKAKSTLFQTKFNLLQFKQLRKYLAIDLSTKTLNYRDFEYDLDRVIDDFVFLSYFVGNDFVPCLPFMNMRDGAFEYILQKYRECAKHLPSYLTNGVHINFDALQIYFRSLANEEGEILTFRTQCFMDRIDPNSPYQPNRGQKRRQKSDTGANKKRKLNDGSSMEVHNKLDLEVLNQNSKSDLKFIRFGKDGYKQRYYRNKFDEVRSEFVNKVANEYLRALSWIQHYYFSGIVSWQWYYPHHYAPLVSDIATMDLSVFSTDALWSTYAKGEPLRPLIQLSLVMPQSSAKLTIPAAYFDAIFCDESELKAYYTESFRMDLNFKQLNWESIAIMQHVNVELLQQVLDAKEDELTDEYKKRNTFGHHLVFVPSAQKQFKDELHTQWGCSVVEKDARAFEEDDDIKVCQFEIKIPSSLHIAKECRACDALSDDADVNEMKLKDINEKNLNIVSQTMCKFFMAGRQTPRGIVRYMKKRPSLWTKSVENLRNGTNKSRKHNGRNLQKRMAFEKQKERKKTEERREERKKNTFISKLKCIGVRQKMNGTNASKLIIDSVLSAIHTSKGEEWNKNKNKNTNQNDNNDNKEIKMNVKMSKTFHKKGNKINAKKKYQRKKKREKLKKMIKGDDMKSGVMNIKRPLNTNDANPGAGSNHKSKAGNHSVQAMERNVQISEVESLSQRKTDSNVKKKRKKKKKKKRKKKNLKHVQ